MAALIDVTTLSGWLDSGRPLTLLDVRWSLAGGVGRDDFAAGHVPGAQLVDLDVELADPPGPGGRHPLPDPDRFAAAMRRSGVSVDVPVVCYDAGDGTAAARAWWLLRFHGHTDVQVLDGGLAAWTAAGGRQQTEVADVPAGDFRPRPSQVGVLDVEDVLAYANNGLMLDARDTVRYRGDVEPVDPVAGHIPGAVSAPTKQNIGADGTFLSPEALRQRFQGLGVSGDRPIAVYCGSGVTAAHEILALELAGHSAALYPGSWSEWIADPERPVATGPT